jgi:hypothetical protein
MSCCGNRNAARHNSPPVWSKTAVMRAGRMADVALQYLGHATLNVMGPVSGRHYRFLAGSTIAVDSRDALSMLSVPGIHPVRR